MYVVTFPMTTKHYAYIQLSLDRSEYIYSVLHNRLLCQIHWQVHSDKYMSFKGLGVTESKLATIESENAGVQHTNPRITSSEPSSQYTRLVRVMVFNATFNNISAIS